MDPVYLQLRDRARQIVSLCPRPRFYLDCADACAWSGNFYLTDPVIARLRRFVSARLRDDFGHGLRHAAKVTLDAGALVVAEKNGSRLSCPGLAREVRSVQCAGLLHDIMRASPDHARAGADFARRLLGGFPLTPVEIDHICSAIGNHEAFKQVAAAASPAANLIDACLYDADKFRWGPDNFTDTIWDMVSYARIPPSVFVRHYPRGMETLRQIRGTFRSPTGRHYGPEFIDIGLEVGWRLYDMIRSEFAGA
jgi:hypothetical protein